MCAVADLMVKPNHNCYGVIALDELSITISEFFIRLKEIEIFKVAADPVIQVLICTILIAIIFEIKEFLGSNYSTEIIYLIFFQLQNTPVNAKCRIQIH
jgi:hypothetical protein